MQIFLVLIQLLLFGIGFYWFLSTASTTDHQLEESWRQLQINNVRKLDDSLSDWLLMLELPQLEEQTRREEVSRRLRTVLIERLLLSQIPDYSPNMSEKASQASSDL